MRYLRMLSNAVMVGLVAAVTGRLYDLGLNLGDTINRAGGWEQQGIDLMPCLAGDAAKFFQPVLGAKCLDCREALAAANDLTRYRPN